MPPETEKRQACRMQAILTDGRKGKSIAVNHISKYLSP
jgi:hypothetical protein